MPAKNEKKIENFIPNFKSNLSLYSLYYAEACNELSGPNSASLRPGNTASFEETLLHWRAVGNTASDLTGPRFEPQTSRSRDESITAQRNIISYLATPSITERDAHDVGPRKHESFADIFSPSCAMPLRSWGTPYVTVLQ